MQFEKSSVNNNINETSNINIRALDFIDCGVIDYYYGLKFETDYSFDKLVSLIGKKIDSVLDNYFQTIKTSFQKDVKEVANNVLKQFIMLRFNIPILLISQFFVD